MGRGESKSRRGRRLNGSPSRSSCCVPRPDLVGLHSCCRGETTGNPAGVLSPRWESVDSRAASPRPSANHLLLPPGSGETSQTPDPYDHSPSILFIIFFQKILLKYSWFTMCSFLLYSNMIPFYIHMLFHYGLSWDIGYSSLCYTARPCHLSMLYSLHLLISNSRSIPHPPPLPWQPQIWRTFVF